MNTLILPHFTKTQKHLNLDLDDLLMQLFSTGYILIYYQKKNKLFYQKQQKGYVGSNNDDNKVMIGIIFFVIQ